MLVVRTIVLKNLTNNSLRMKMANLLALKRSMMRICCVNIQSFEQRSVHVLWAAIVSSSTLRDYLNFQVLLTRCGNSNHLLIWFTSIRTHNMKTNCLKIMSRFTKSSRLGNLEAIMKERSMKNTSLIWMKASMCIIMPAILLELVTFRVYTQIKRLILSMKEGGLTNSLMGKDWSIIIKDITKVNILKDKKRVWESLFGVKAQCMRVAFWRELFTVKANIKINLWTIFTKESIVKTWSMVRDFKKREMNLMLEVLTRERGVVKENSLDM